MTTQTAIHFTWDEALNEDIRALGGRKKLAPRLWPTEDEETALDRLKCALAPGHKQQLKPAEVLKIKEWARDVGSYATVTFEGQVLGFRPEWIAPEDEDVRLQREFISAVDKLHGIQQAIERNGQRARRAK